MLLHQSLIRDNKLSINEKFFFFFYALSCNAVSYTARKLVDHVYNVDDLVIRVN